MEASPRPDPLPFRRGEGNYAGTRRQADATNDVAEHSLSPHRMRGEGQGEGSFRALHVLIQWQGQGEGAARKFIAAMRTLHHRDFFRSTDTIALHPALQL